MTGHPAPEPISALSCGDGNQGAVCFQSHVALVWRAWCWTAVETLLEGRNHSEGMSSTARLWSLESQGIFFKNQDVQPHPPDRWAAGDLLYCLAFEPRESPLTSVALPGWPVALVPLSSFVVNAGVHGVYLVGKQFKTEVPVLSSSFPLSFPSLLMYLMPPSALTSMTSYKSYK